MFLCIFYILDVTGEMEVTVQEDEERPPPPPPEEQSTSDSRDPRTANRNPALELAESIVDSVLGPCTSEATIRLSNIPIVFQIKILCLKCYYNVKTSLIILFLR